MKFRKRNAAFATMAIGALVTGMAVTGTASASPVSLPNGNPVVLNVVVTQNGFYVDGPTTFPAGVVRLVLDNAKPASGHHSSDAEIVKLASGYSWSDFRADFAVMAQNLFAPHGDVKKGLAAEAHLLGHTTFVGGLDVLNGERRYGAVLLSHPGGRYFVYHDNGMPKQKTRLTVTSPVGPQTLPDTNKTVTATNKRNFRGDTRLPSNGTITFRNKSHESPHMLILQHVADGTTKRQILKAFSGNGDFSFIRKGEQGSDVVDEGLSDVINLHQRAGTYAALCFFPDPKTGMPHFLMGMVRVVKLV